MKSGKAMMTKHAIRAALCAVMLGAGAGSARALELKDLIIEFDTIYQVVEKPPRPQPYTDKHKTRIDAIAGKLVLYTGTCGSLVYQPGTLTGTVDCPADRTGVGKNWSEEKGASSYTTSMTVVGNVVTLQGKLTSRRTYESNWCGRNSKNETLDDVTQSVRIRITGNTCHVLQFNTATVTTRRDTYRSDGDDLKTEDRTATDRLAPNAKCTIRRRSEEPIRPPGGPVSATRNC
jgi:hypothetical protein